MAHLLAYAHEDGYRDGYRAAGMTTLYDPTPEEQREIANALMMAATSIEGLTRMPFVEPTPQSVRMRAVAARMVEGLADAHPVAERRDEMSDWADGIAADIVPASGIEMDRAASARSRLADFLRNTTKSATDMGRLLGSAEERARCAGIARAIDPSGGSNEAKARVKLAARVIAAKIEAAP